MNGCMHTHTPNKGENSDELELVVCAVPFKSCFHFSGHLIYESIFTVKFCSTETSDFIPI